MPHAGSWVHPSRHGVRHASTWRCFRLVTRYARTLCRLQLFDVALHATRISPGGMTAVAFAAAASMATKLARAAAGGQALWW